MPLQGKTHRVGRNFAIVCLMTYRGETGRNGRFFRRVPRLPGALLITFLCTASCTAAPPAAGLRVVASFYTLAHFAEQVGGDRIRVVSVAPTGAQPHGWEPSPRAVKEAVSADIFLYQGAGLDPWAEDVAPDVASRGGVVVEMTKHFDLLGDNDVPGHPAHVHGPGPGAGP